MHQAPIQEQPSSKPASSTRKNFLDFFRLPAELRDRIYDLSVQHIVAEEANHQVDISRLGPEVNAKQVNPPLSLANRKVRNESLLRHNMHEVWSSAMQDPMQSEWSVLRPGSTATDPGSPWPATSSSTTLRPQDVSATMRISAVG